MLEAEVGLYLRLRVEGGQLEVQAAALVPRWSKRLLHSPILTREAQARFRYPGTETVLAMLDERGGIVASFGFSEQPRVFFDRTSKHREGLTGKTGDAAQKIREIRVPLPESTRFLCFYRSELTFTKDSRIARPEIRQECVALYSTARPGEAALSPPHLPVPAPQGMPASPLRWLPPPDARRSR